FQAEDGIRDLIVTGVQTCALPISFVVGTSYLVYASTSDRQLTTGICSGTKPEVMVGGLLKELRAVRDGTRVDDLFGTIGIGPTRSEERRVGKECRCRGEADESREK